MNLALKVIPGSSRDEIVGWLGDALKVKVRAKAEQGKANAAVEKTLAKALGLGKQDVRITTGLTNSRKILAITGLTDAEIRIRLNKVIG